MTAARKHKWTKSRRWWDGGSEKETCSLERCFWRQSVTVSLAIPCLLWGQILEGSEGRVARRRGRHSLHFAWRVCGGADAAEAAIQQIWRVTGTEVWQVGDIRGQHGGGTLEEPLGLTLCLHLTFAFHRPKYAGSDAVDWALTPSAETSCWAGYWAGC